MKSLDRSRGHRDIVPGSANQARVGMAVPSALFGVAARSPDEEDKVHRIHLPSALGGAEPMQQLGGKGDALAPHLNFGARMAMPQ